MSANDPKRTFALHSIDWIDVHRTGISTAIAGWSAGARHKLRSDRSHCPVIASVGLEASYLRPFFHCLGAKRETLAARLRFPVTFVHLLYQTVNALKQARADAGSAAIMPWRTEGEF